MDDDPSESQNAFQTSKVQTCESTRQWRGTPF